MFFSCFSVLVCFFYGLPWHRFSKLDGKWGLNKFYTFSIFICFVVRPHVPLASRTLQDIKICIIFEIWFLTIPVPELCFTNNETKHTYTHTCRYPSIHILVKTRVNLSHPTISFHYFLFVFWQAQTKKQPCSERQMSKCVHHLDFVFRLSFLAWP